MLRQKSQLFPAQQSADCSNVLIRQGCGAPNALKSDLKKPRICPIWGQSDPL